MFHPSSSTKCHFLLHRGVEKSNYNLIKDEHRPSPQPSPIGEGVSNKLNNEIQSGVQDDAHSPKLTYSFINLFSYLSRKRAAFTLAEVLITLGIIGVVAAMTMPSLIANYQNRVLLTAVKKTYSVFNNAVKLALSDRESTDIITVFDTANTSLQTTETLQKYFNGAVLCTKSSTLCPAYSVKAQYGKKNAVTGASVYQSSMAPPYLKLVDGSFIKIHQHSSCITERQAQRCKEDSSGNVIPNSDGTDCEYEYSTWIDTRCAMVQIDTNGIKAPNQYGADIYQIGIYENGKINGVASNGRLDTVLSTDEIDYIKYNVDD